MSHRMDEGYRSATETGRTAMTTTQNRPWQDAEIHEGTIPQQASLYPRPVILECGECGTPGYWYPAEDRIDVRSRMCPVLNAEWRPYHPWRVSSWNGNERIAGITSRVDEEWQ